jgi:opacity protein-like surface antigen
MKTAKITIFTGAATFALTTWVSCLQAQPSAPVYSGAPYAGAATVATPGHYYLPSPTGKLYAGFDAGAAFQQDIRLYDTIGDSETVSMGTGVRLDCQLGYNFTPNWAAELEIGLIANDVNNSVILGTDFMDVTFVEMPIMANVIYTRPLGRHFSAYIGGGVGGAFSSYGNEFGGTTASDTTFAFQGLAGLKYTINERWDLGVTYKFLGTTEHDVGPGFDSNGNETEFKSSGTMTHSVLLALTCKF